MKIPTQENHDPSDPRQHVAWALRNLPMIAGVGAITHPGYLAGWSEHLWRAGFRHVDWIRGLADENGYIHVSQLPEQEIKFQPPFRGQRHHVNNAARWVDKDTPDPKPVVIPDIRKFTEQENLAVLKQYEEEGWISEGRIGPPMAEVVDG
ncbi:minor tail protein [Mycobacterium phage Phlei]|uniref:Minor tail protein n=1 Tax=Mycobacterium phage Phlei TaxID=1690684 RepID=A0A0N9BDQ7_9CAUD|nr:minor tail protein [Mycobacterium phage Phlei]ALA48137.1 hypothetical protein [Mycobacterium phage Phlei]